MTQSVMQEAAGVLDSRRNAYGNPLPNHERIAKLWTVILKRDTTPQEVAMCMMALKISRLVETPDHRDSMVDICGYADCLDQINRGLAEVAENASNHTSPGVAVSVCAPLVSGKTY